MQPQQPKRSPVPIIVLVLVLGALGYFFYSGRNDSSVGLIVNNQNNNDVLGKDLLAALGKINAIQLDNSIFQSPVYGSLSDFSVEIVPQPVGRDNPFSPLEVSAPTGGAAASQAPTAPLKKTIPAKKH